eukprot:1160526-Pelagomonas_calceolata.AAC.14
MMGLNISTGQQLHLPWHPLVRHSDLLHRQPQLRPCAQCGRVSQVGATDFFEWAGSAISCMHKEKKGREKKKTK